MFRFDLVRLIRVLSVLCAWLCIDLVAPRAHAGGEIVVAEFGGAKPVGVRERVIEQLRSEGYSLVDDKSTPTVDASEGDSYFADLAAEGGYRAFVLGYTKMANTGWSTSLTVREGKTGKVVGKTSIGAGWYPGLVKALDQKVASKLKGPLDRAEGPEGSAAEEEPEPVPMKEAEPEDEPDREEAREEEEAPPEDEQEEDDETEESASVELDDLDDDFKRHRDKSKRKDPALELDVGGLFLQRQWKLVDPVAGPGAGPILATHDVPLLGVQAELGLYPVAFFDDKSFLRHIGFTVAYLRSYKARSQFPGGGAERATLFEELDFGGRIRIPLAKQIRVGLVGGGGAQALSVAGNAQANPHPDPIYEYWYAGADFGMFVGKLFEFELGGAYRGLLGAGEEYGQIQAPEWFPDTTGFALQGYVDGILWFHKMVGARLGLNFTRYALDFQPSLDALADAAAAGQEAPPVAGGATDLYWGVDLSVVLAVY